MVAPPSVPNALPRRGQERGGIYARGYSDLMHGLRRPLVRVRMAMKRTKTMTMTTTMPMPSS
eukprot:7141822-Pyramimonas_sp.AAC.1